MKRLLVFRVMVAAALVFGGAVSAGADEEEAKGENSAAEVKWKSIDLDKRYRCFVKNWDNKAESVLVRVLASPSQWDAVMAPAATGMNPKTVPDPRPFAPGDPYFDDYAMVVIARVTDKKDSHTAVERVVLKNNVLSVFIHHHEGGDELTYQRKSVTAVQVPAGDYKKVVLFENEEEIDPARE